ncbi:MAG: heat-inducible transcriptional repressor HrcA [Woeseiaceae bacterium]|nr:heat-inducible transcriptional repressor HrcA [Woeseiaceae bacterium]
MSRQAVSNAPNDRAKYLLKILIQRFIQDGQPVGSRTLSRESRLDLSPATIRNVLSDLEEMGFVSAPHTSAGRVPTPRGYRMFVDTLVQYKRPGDDDIRRLQRRLAASENDPDLLVNSVSTALSRLTSLAGVVTVPKGQQATLRQIEFLPLSDNRVLAILVINDREVQNRILHTERNYSADELQRAANFINEHYAGADLADIHARLVRDLQETRESMNQAMLDIISVAQSAIDGTSSQKSGFVVTGETNLMDFAELSDIDKLRRLFEAFSRKRLMIDLLDRSMNASGVQIFIGEESGYQILDDCSVVTAPYRIDDDKVGVLGVIGPTRMAYDRVVPIVEVTARMLGSALNVPD